MQLFLVVILALVLVALIIVAMSREITRRANEVSDVNTWFSEQSLICPPEALPPNYAATVRSVMDDDSDLWWHLAGGYREIDHEPYHRQVVDLGRYLSVFGPLGPRPSEHCPSLYYGVFDYNDEPVFRVWIEFRYLGETVWVLTEGVKLPTEDTNVPKITRFSDFRVNHPGCIYRHSLYFAHDGIDLDRLR